MGDVMDTAVVIARVRADEAGRPPAERLFADPYAALFADAGSDPEVIDGLRSVPVLAWSVRLRTRWIDDAVRAALARGVRQLVLLGAGYDCRALRLPEIEAAGARVFEVDFAEQLARKRTGLARGRIALPSWIRHVPCDFTAPAFDQALLAALTAAGLERSAGALFVWEGVAGYLDDDAVDRTLRLVAAAGGTGAGIVLNYALNRFGPEALAARLTAAGLRVIEDLALATLHDDLRCGARPAGAEIFRVAAAEVGS